MAGCRLRPSILTGRGLSNPILCPFSLMCSRAMGSLIPNHVLHLDEDGATAGHSSHATRNPTVVGRDTWMFQNPLLSTQRGTLMSHGICFTPVSRVPYLSVPTATTDGWLCPVSTAGVSVPVARTGDRRCVCR